MKIFIATLRSNAPYGQSKYHTTKKKVGELDGEYEERTWREKAHVDKDGYVFIPPTAFKNALSEAAKYRSEKIIGQGKKTYAKKFESGISVPEGITLPIKKEDLLCKDLMVPSDGQRGGTKRVPKCFPYVEEWEGKIGFWILDDIISYDVFYRHLEDCGKFIGIGFSRPSRNGSWGRFSIVNLEEGLKIEKEE